MKPVPILMARFDDSPSFFFCSLSIVIIYLSSVSLLSLSYTLNKNASAVCVVNFCVVLSMTKMCCRFLRRTFNEKKCAVDFSRSVSRLVVHRFVMNIQRHISNIVERMKDKFSK